MRPVDYGLKDHGFLQHVADIGGSGRISKHRGFQIIGSETLPDRKAEQIDDFIGMWPNQMSAENPTALVINQCLISVHGFADPARWYQSEIFSDFTHSLAAVWRAAASDNPTAAMGAARGGLCGGAANLI